MREVQLLEVDERVESFETGEAVACAQRFDTSAPHLARRAREESKEEDVERTLNAQCSETGQAVETLNLGDLVLAEEEGAEVGGHGEVLDRLHARIMRE